jgi:hypothetical protein
VRPECLLPCTPQGCQHSRVDHVCHSSVTVVDTVVDTVVRSRFAPRQFICPMKVNPSVVNTIPCISRLPPGANWHPEVTWPTTGSYQSIRSTQEDLWTEAAIPRCLQPPGSMEELLHPAPDQRTMVRRLSSKAQRVVQKPELLSVRQLRSILKGERP